MRTYLLERQQTFQVPLEEVFSFFNRPENLERITPKKLGFQILTPTPIRMDKGTLIDYIISPLGFPMRWTTLITDYDPPRFFVDQQIRGPYAYWHHTHAFESTPEGVLMKDRVIYAIGLGFLGAIAHHLWIRRQLTHIFDYRQQIIADVFSKKR